MPQQFLRRGWRKKLQESENLLNDTTATCDLTRKKEPYFSKKSGIFCISFHGCYRKYSSWPELEMQRRLWILNDTGPELEYLKDSKRKIQNRDKNINMKNKFKDEQKLEATTQHKQCDALPKNKVAQKSIFTTKSMCQCWINTYYNYKHQYRFFFQKISYVIIINTAAFLKKLKRNIRSA